ncbi:mechanosensitive ion channel family protein [Butyrivibrio sp. XPD2006]|uniref:mechanosensitive ion channel family protein n=1 Tax=Butyrivibrio sp. XPD2006 TaxID=1280668 RepID=UPI0003B67A54|nr:mechanosensitive ion channel family protein [Butyrivibrio sp. XPD2006]
MQDSGSGVSFEKIISGLFWKLQGSDRAWLVVIAIVVILIVVALYVFFVILLLKLNKRIFKSIEKKKGNSITIQFLQKAVSLGIMVILVVLPLGGQRLAQSLLGSTAVVAVIVGLAANEVLKDMFAGLEISLYKPFDVGSRIMLEDGRAGIVEKMTLRHVVLKLIDTTRLIVPNSKANQGMIVNYSYEEYVPRSFDVCYGIGYNSDIDKAKDIIRQTICECPLTLNKDKYKEDDPGSRSVYFLEVKDSALMLGATVYYPHEIRTEVVKDQVNTAVFKALVDNGIEIPYNYVNLVVKKENEDA